ncbi:MAG: lysophospholipase [Candidatus Hydrogenedentes bacterium]|nr:lysophospholipase [Candidatus Hydrogenedentota bacterium]
MSEPDSSPRETYFKTADDIRLRELAWETDRDARAAVLIVHGFGHHAACFQDVAALLNTHGFNCHALDLRGHGKSEGRRGHVASYEQALDDVRLFLGRVRERIAATPLVLFGHSMGALIAALIAAEDKSGLHGLILSSGLLRIPGHVSPLLLALAGVLGRVFPYLPVQPVDLEAISRDTSFMESMRVDSLRYFGRMNARTGLEMMKAMRRLDGCLEQIAVPLLVLHGTDDRLTDPEGSRVLHARAGSADKTVRLFDGGYHELFNDYGKEEYLSVITEWLVARSRMP